jgi:hypothetical protein
VSRVNTRTGRGVVGSSSTAWLTPPPLEGMTTGVDTGSLLLKKMTRRSGCEAGAAEFLRNLEFRRCPEIYVTVARGGEEEDERGGENERYSYSKVRVLWYIVAQRAL